MMRVMELKNGLRVILIPVKGARAVSVKLFVKIGSKYEKKGEFGMSHFLEHMAFKGTKRRQTAVEIAKEVDSKGAVFNAATDWEATYYYVTTGGQNLAWAMELLADVVFDSVLKEVEVDKERGVIREELKMYEDNPIMGLRDDFVDFLYGKSKIGCWNIGGKVSDIDKISLLGLLDFQKRYFEPKRMVVAIAGSERALKGLGQRQVDDCFGRFENKVSGDLPEVKLRLNEQKEKMRFKRGLEQGHFCVGVPGFSLKDERKYALWLLVTILAGNRSSRLYEKMREELGWAYYVDLVDEMFEEGGLVGVQSGVRKENLTAAVGMVKQEMRGLSNSLRETELVRAKDYYQGRWAMYMDEVGFWSGFVGRRLLEENRLVGPEERLRRWEKVRLEELKEVAENLFAKDSFWQLLVADEGKRLA